MENPAQFRVEINNPTSRVTQQRRAESKLNLRMAPRQETPKRHALALVGPSPMDRSLASATWAVADGRATFALSPGSSMTGEREFTGIQVRVPSAHGGMVIRPGDSPTISLLKTVV